MGLMEMALSMEIQAYDLYRTMADRVADGEVKAALLAISDMEKQHMQLLAGAFGQCNP